MVMKYRVCECCEKWHEVDLPKRPGLYRKRGADGDYHEFMRHMPVRSRWETANRWCIVCNGVRKFTIGPVTGKQYCEKCG